MPPSVLLAGIITVCFMTMQLKLKECKYRALSWKAECDCNLKRIIFSVFFHDYSFYSWCIVYANSGIVAMNNMMYMLYIVLHFFILFYVIYMYIYVYVCRSMWNLWQWWFMCSPVKDKVCLCLHNWFSWGPL